jgi:DNA-binding transcriptional LysR family regulator
MLALGDLTTMALFAEVVELRSFTRAARTSGMAKATVSRRIADLERRLGVRLLQRTTRQVTPTEDGKRLYERCTEVVAAAREASELLLDTSGQPAGVLRVAAPIAFTHQHLTPAVVDFLGQYPDIQVQLIPRSAPTDLVAEEIDLAIRVGKVDPSLIARRLATDSVVVVGSPEYFRRHGIPQTLSDLEQHVSLRFSWEAEHPRWRFRGAKRRGGLALKGSLVATDASVIRDAAILGLGVASLPSHVVAEEVRAGRLVRVLERTRVPDLPINVVYPERTLPARARKLVEFLIDRFASPQWQKSALLV